jgi:putative membrane protein
MADRGDTKPDPRTDLARVRTRLAAERTLDAWVRTALSMISFGFTIAKFLEDFEKGRNVLTPHAPRNFGLALVILGILSLAAAVYQHVALLKALGEHPFRRPVSLATIVAMLVVLLGVLALLSIATNLGPI